MYSAHQSLEEIEVSSTAVYDKLSTLEPGVSSELVRYSDKQLVPIVSALESERPESESCQGNSHVWLEGYQTRILDDSCIEVTDHRIGELRETEDAPANEEHADSTRLNGEVACSAQRGLVTL